MSVRPGKLHRFAPWLFISPWLLGLLGLFAYPFVASLIWSFTEYDLLTAPRYVGTDNYQRVADEILRGEGFGKGRVADKVNIKNPSSLKKHSFPISYNYYTTQSLKELKRSSRAE